MDLGQDLLHARLGIGVDDPGAAHEITVLGGIRNRVPHIGNAILIDEINDELDLVNALEIRHLRRIARLHQGFETRLHERCQAAAKNRLLAEEIRLGLLLEGGLDDARTAAADGARIGQTHLQRISTRILVNRHQTGNPPTRLVVVPHRVAGALGRHHEDVHVLGRRDGTEMKIETMGHREVVPRLELGRNLFGVDIRRQFVRQGQHQDIGLARRLAHRRHGESGPFSLGPTRRVLAQPHHHVDAGVVQVLGVGMALAPVTDDRHLLALEAAQVCVLVVVDIECHRCLFTFRVAAGQPAAQGSWNFLARAVQGRIRPPQRAPPRDLACCGIR